MSPTVTISTASTTPPFEQLRRQLELQIRTGALTAGDRLPTVRQLSGDLGLAKNTVVRAFRELEEAGLIAGAGRNGTIILGGLDHTYERRRIINEAAHRLLDDINIINPTLDELTDAIRQLAPPPPTTSTG